MNNGNSSALELYGKLVAQMSASLATGDDAEFERAMDEIVRLRERSLFTELSRLTGGLKSALDRFRLDSRIVDLAEKEMPDARHRLDHVLKLTDDAAHKTLDLVERSAPIAERTHKAAGELLSQWRRYLARDIDAVEFRAMLKRIEGFLVETQNDADAMRRNLTEVLMTQGFQDLSGQIIRGVMKLVMELETVLGELTVLAADGERAPQPAKKEVRQEKSETDKEKLARGFGPPVPGVDHGPAVSGQQDVDSLLSGLGL